MTNKNRKRLVFAWWGTGWHIFPIINLLHYLDDYHADDIDAVFWIASKEWLEHDLATKTKFQHFTVTFLSITSWKRRRQRDFHAIRDNLVDLVCVGYGILISLIYLIKYRTDVIFCKWWHVALPVVLAWMFLKKRIIVHESDTRMWLTNCIASKMASHIFTAFPHVHPHWILIGQIIADVFSQKIDKQDFDELLGTPSKVNQTQVLIMWWSQGATSMYQWVAHAMKSHPEVFAPYNFVVVLGILNHQQASLFAWFPNVQTLWFCSQAQMSVLYQYCDISITRAGTTSLAEQKLLNMLLCIVPLPRTHDQVSNANYYFSTHQDILIAQDQDMSINFVKTFSVLQHFKKTKADLSDISNTIAKVKQTISHIILTDET